MLAVAPASPGLERLAEDGNTEPLGGEFASLGDESAVWQNVVHMCPLCPGEYQFMTIEVLVDPLKKLYFSYASMVLPSNDAFVGNGHPMAYPVFNIGAKLVDVLVQDAGSDILDAGTEVNDELPQNTAFFGQMAPDTGVDENGVVYPHPGFLPEGSGGILDDPNFENADFMAPGYQALEIVVIENPGSCVREDGRKSSSSIE